MFGFAKRAKNLYVASFNFNLLYTVRLRDCKTLQRRQPLASFYESHLLQIRVESSPQLVFYARWSSLSALRDSSWTVGLLAKILPETHFVELIQIALSDTS